tara:strand:+ start:334647 stop:334991 length:345 start_codon:yes stop_codon:yes gene_type:complete
VKYDRAMIDLLREIRRHVDSELKAELKLASPDLLYKLRDIYRSSDNAVINALIKELYFKAGPQWMVQLEEASVEQQQPSQKIYRGQPQFVEIAPEQGSGHVKKSKMYRGHPVID